MRKRRTNPQKRVLTEYEIKKAIEQAKQEAAHELMISSLTIAMMSAHDVFDYGPVRLERLMDDMLRKYNDLEAGLFSVEDSAEWLKDYAGIIIQDI